MTRLPKRTIRALTPYAILAATAVCIGWLAVFDGNQGNPKSSTLDRGINGAPESLDPSMFSSNQSRTILRDLGEGLVTLSASGEVVPGSAESWEVRDNGREYTFILRDSARWSDGDPVVAADFVAAFHRLVDPDNPARNAAVISDVKNYNEVVGRRAPVHDLEVRALDPRTLQIRLADPSASFLQKLTHPAAFPSKQTDPSSGLAQVWNGPYILGDWEDNSLIRLEKNAYYWDASNTGYEVVNYHVVEETAEYSRFRAGELDITGNVTASQYEKVQKEHPAELRVSPYLGVYYFGFNLDHPLIGDDLKLRQALSLAIDRDVLVTKLLGRGELPATDWIPPDVRGFDYSLRGDGKRNVAASLELARDLFQQSKYATRFTDKDRKLTLHYNNSDVQKRIAIAVQSMWYDALGIDVEIIGVDFRVLLSQIQHGKEVQAFRLSWTGDYNDAENFLEVFESQNSSNFTKYKNDAFDELLGRAKTETNSSARAVLLARAEQIMLAEQPVIPLYFYVSKHLVSKSVSGWEPNVLDEHPSKFLRPSTEE